MESEKIEADDARVKAKVEEIAVPYDHPKEVVDWYYGDKQRLAEVKALVTEEQVVDWAIEKAKIVDKKCTFKEIMSPEQNK